MSIYLLLRVLFFLWVPGLALAASIRVRGNLVLLLSPALSVGLMSLYAVLNTFIPLPYPRIEFFFFVALLCGFGYWLSRVLTLPIIQLPEHEQGADRDWLHSFIAWLSGILAGTAGMWTFQRALGDVDLSPTLWDLQFHNGLLRFMDQHNAISPFFVTSFAGGTPIQAGAMYPNALHLTAFFAYQDNPMPALNAVAIICVGMFGLGMALLASLIFQKHLWAAPLTGFLSLDFMAFNAKVFATGGRWAYGFGFSLTPWLLIVIWALWLHISEQQRFGAYLQAIIIFLAAVLAGFNGHAGALYLLGAITIPAGLYLVLVNRKDSAKRNLALVSLALQLLTTFGLLFYGLGHVGAIKYGKLSEFSDALLEGLSGGEMSRWYPSTEKIGSWSLLIMVIMALIGLALFKGRRWWLLVELNALGLYVAAVYISVPWYVLIHPLYNDRTRVACLLSLTMPLIITAGWSNWAEKLELLVPNVNAKRVVSIGIPAALILATVLPGGFARSTERFEILNAAARVPGHDLLTEPEVTLMRSFAKDHPGGMLGHPATGAPLYYAVTGEPAFPRYTSMNATKEERKALTSIDQVFSNPEVCQMANKLGWKYFYFDTELYRSGNIGDTKSYEALVNLGEARDHLEQVASSGTVTIYRLPCSN
ncbi:DUF6541 family protein [Boudabousia liubingyangii]|uniref:DUF6541 family protein n=1 Tax=Boudabousia liubingyangii TaxID=1921764 RepID=UPI00093BB512